MKNHGLLAGLIEIQNADGYLSDESITAVADQFGISASEAYSTATFYSFLTRKKVGKYQIRVCESAPCHIAGAPDVIKALESALGIKMGEATPDGKFSLEFVGCIGRCGGSPCITVNDVPYENLVPDTIPALLKQIEEEVNYE